jgi:hypothetical protein
VNALYAVYEEGDGDFRDKYFRDADGRGLQASQGVACAVSGWMHPTQVSGTRAVDDRGFIDELERMEG